MRRRMADGWPSSSTAANAWSQRLEGVLQDRTALDAFKAWMSANSSCHPLELHFAIVAHTNMCVQRNPQSAELAKRIYEKYISNRTGVCGFIQPGVRQEVGARVRSLQSVQHDPRIFDAIAPYLDTYLRRQHEEFIQSGEFLEVFNATCYEDEDGMRGGATEGRTGFAPSPFHSTQHNQLHSSMRSKSGQSAMRESTRSSRTSSSSGPPPFPGMTQQHRSSSSQRHHSQQQPQFVQRTTRSGYAPSNSGPPTLTAQTLLMTQRDRETTLGESALERMYPPRHPYVCRATTSQNDSAVSSSFSASDHSASHHHRPPRLSAIREEHLRANPKTFTIPRNGDRHDGKQYNHETEEGRKKFGEDLANKLQKVAADKRKYEANARLLKQITDQPVMARTVVSTTVAPPDVALDDEDDVEEYLSRLRVDSSGGGSAATRSPRGGALSPKPLNTHSQPQQPSTSFFSPGLTINAFAPPPASFSSHQQSPFGNVGGGYMHSHLGTNHHNQFAPPPGVAVHFDRHHNGKMVDGNSSSLYDSSGIESLAPSDEPARRRSLPGNGGMSASPSRKLMSTSAHHGKRESRRREETKGQLLTISYKGLDGVPVVAHVPTADGSITLKEFRRHFSIPRQAGIQFFFKTECMDAEDEEEEEEGERDSGAPASYQLLLVSDDSSLLPLFNGRVAAELKRVQLD